MGSSAKDKIKSEIDFVYISTDGKRFLDLKSAIEHQEKIDSIYFLEKK
tara:strand:- start:825 stop:968 length:144 start_codon:yes stop_codon:yes gene_type:complete